MTLFAEAGSPARPRLAKFQAEAVEAILEILARRGGALLADAAGLGKSWVAAEVAARWEAEGGVAEVVAPASLLTQWRDVASSFGLEATLWSHDAWRRGTLPARGRPRLVVVDEAHRFRNPRTRRYGFLARSTLDAAVLLVTATPFCNHADDLRALLTLLVADDALADRGVASIDEVFRARREGELRTVLDELSIARGRDVLPAALEFVPPETSTIRYRPAGRHERALETALAGLSFPLVTPRAAELLRPFLRRRLESSVAALRSTLVRLRKLHARALECAARGVALDRAGYRAAFGDPDAPLFQDVLFPELWSDGVRRDAPDPATLRRELAVLETSIGVLDARLSADPKMRIVGRIVASQEGRPGLVFTQSRDTADALWRTLRAERRCALVTGGGCRNATGAPSRLDEIVAMLSRGAIDVVVATDVGCEGLNLQSASFAVHADLPWSPAKLEQRIGRVGRIGQKASRVDEFMVVPRRSPVALALARKSRERGRFSPRPESSGVSLALRLDSGLVVDARESLAVVDLVERRGARETRSTRPIEPSGLTGSPGEGRELLRRLGSSGTAGDAAAERQVALAVAAWLRLVSCRELQPARVDASSPQARLLEAAERAGLVTPALVSALSRRYRAGAELEIARLAAEGFDAPALDALVRVLGTIARPEPLEARVEGFVVSRGWIRSAAGFRRPAR